jgi:hypothetical protein
MRRRNAFVLLALLSASFLACTKGDECDRCSQDSECKGGFVCTTFSDGSMRCGTGTGASTCRVRN